MMKFHIVIQRKFKTILRSPKVVLIKGLQFLSPILPDSLYLRLLFPLATGYRLNLSAPKTYNEKLQWLKIYFRKPIMTIMVDKYSAKELIAKTVGVQYVVETYGVWDSFDDIDFASLPSNFVLKTTHDQGGVCIVKDKRKFNLQDARKGFKRRQRKNHYWLTREWPYKNVKPRIMAEELLVDDNQKDLADYKFYCFDGKPEVMYIAQGRQEGNCTFDFFDMNFKKLDIKRPKYSSAKGEIGKPEFWNEMIEIAEKLSFSFPHLRVDFYICNNKLYVGELTFFQGGGMMPFVPESWDYIMGDYINLPSTHNK